MGPGPRKGILRITHDWSRRNRCHPERSEGSLIGVSEGSLATLGMTVCAWRYGAPSAEREGDIDVGFGAVLAHAVDDAGRQARVAVGAFARTELGHHLAREQADRARRLLEREI